jgi:hypothetical protein
LVKSCIIINAANIPKISLLGNTVLKILLPFQTTWMWIVLRVGLKLKLRQKQTQCGKWSSQCTQALTTPWFKKMAKAEWVQGPSKWVFHFLHYCTCPYK